MAGPPVLRSGLKSLLETDPRIAVAAALEVRPELLETRADVLVVAGEPDWLSRATRLPPAVLLIGAGPWLAETLRRLAPAAWGVLPPDASAEELTAAVAALAAGLVCAPRTLLDPLLRRPPGDAPGPAGAQPRLSPREIQVLEAMAKGLANKEIARELGMSEHTVKFHTSAIYARLGASNRAEAVRVGIQSGLLLL